MKSISTLVVSADIHADLRAHLFPGDGCEAAAILLCARSPGSRLRLLAQQLIRVPYEACALREPDRISWPGQMIEEAIDRGEADGLSIILVHSHPGGFFSFSDLDDASDAVTIRAIGAAYSAHHGSAIMVPSGAIRARIYNSELTGSDLALVLVPGNDIRTYWSDQSGDQEPPLAFTSAMTEQNRRLSALVIGASGTGSPTIEQLLRLGFGRVVGVEFDAVENKNLNRILNATLTDAANSTPKVEVMSRAAESHRGPNVFVAVQRSIMDREAIVLGSDCDVIFCCVDTLEARYIADLMGAALLMPLIDVGVTIPTRKTRSGSAIADVFGRVDYVYPGGSTLSDRGVYSPAALEAEYLRANSPEAHREKLEDGYIQGLIEEAPAVISLNMRGAAAAVNELLARLYPFRHDPNHRYARTTFSLAAGEEEYIAEAALQRSGTPKLATGSREPLLGLPALRAAKQ